MNYEKIDNIIVENIGGKDHPDYADSYILSADYNGKPMTQEQLDEINDDTDFVHRAVLKEL
jgi:hypothetical protein